MVLWDSGCLAGLIATTYPLKPHGTAAPVSLGEGDVGPPRKGRVASVSAFVCNGPFDLGGATLPWVTRARESRGRQALRGREPASGRPAYVDGVLGVLMCFTSPEARQGGRGLGLVACGVSCSLAVGARGPGGSAPVAGPLLRTGP